MTKQARCCTTIALGLFIAVVQANSWPKDSELRPMNEVETLMFRSDTMTNTIPSHQQLVCTGECPEISTNEAVCSNYGLNDMGAVVWQCLFRVIGNNGVRQPKLRCKGKMHSSKQYLLPGTCRMAYEGTKKEGKWNFRRAAACMDVISTVADAINLVKNPGSLLTKSTKSGGFDKLKKVTKRAGVAASVASSVWQCTHNEQTDELHEVTAHVIATLE